MELDYRFNGGRGAVLCNKCRVIVDADLSKDEALLFYPDGVLCAECRVSQVNAPADGEED